MAFWETDFLNGDPRAGETLAYFDWAWGKLMRARGRAELAEVAAVLSALTRLGHTCLPLEKIGHYLDAFFQLIPNVIENQSNQWIFRLDDHCLGDGTDPTPLVLDQKGLYFYRTWHLEQSVAKALIKRLRYPMSFITDRGTSKSAVPFTPHCWPKVAIGLITSGSRITCISGGPGTGKSTLIKQLISAFLECWPKEVKKRPCFISLCAPTGKAVERLEGLLDPEMKKLGHITAQTVHALLKISINNRPPFYQARLNPLPADLLIVDEASMLSLELLDHLLTALDDATQLVLVGDPNQLPPIEIGSPFQDLCSVIQGFSDSNQKVLSRLYTSFPQTPKKVFVNAQVQLKHVFRYQADSGIAACTHAVASGDIEAVKAVLEKPWSDLHWYAEASPQAVLTWFRQGGPAFKDPQKSVDPTIIWDSLKKRVLLTPLQSSELGAQAMNALLNPAAAKSLDRPRLAGLPLGTPILITRNLPDHQLVNGDLGMVWDASWSALPLLNAPEAECVWFFKEGKWVSKRLDDLIGAFTLAHALTVHKAQGSEFDHVAVILPQSVGKQTWQITRSWLYTAITRAKSDLTIIGSDEALQAAIQTQGDQHGGLKQTLEQYGALDRI